jgi:5-methylcytosine-specific restriction endonuclease McrA
MIKKCKRKPSVILNVGDKIGKISILEPYKYEKRYNRTFKVYKCQCKCGRIVYLDHTQLIRNQLPSCKKCRLTASKDLVGKKYNNLLVLRKCKEKQGTNILWECLCDCGNLTKVITGALTSGHTKSCGCINYNRGPKLTWAGQKFGRLTIIKSMGRKWLCKCDCGQETLVISQCIKDGRTKSCGCLKRELMSGKNSKFWKGGVTKEYRKIRKKNQCIQWAKNIKTRDKYICQKCLNTNKLCAHHIKDFKNNKKTRLDINNGITLCEDCHKKFHKKYGKTNTTNEQLQEFLNET